MRRRFRTPILVGLLGIALGMGPVATLAASPAAAQPADTPQANYRAKANQICARAKQRLAGAARDYELSDEVSRSGAKAKKIKVAKPKEVATFIIEVAAKELADELQKLKALEVPTADAAVMKQIFADADKALARIKAAPASAAWEDPFGKVAKQLKAQGFSDCAKPTEVVAPLVTK